MPERYTRIGDSQDAINYYRANDTAGDQLIWTFQAPAIGPTALVREALSVGARMHPSNPWGHPQSVLIEPLLWVEATNATLNDVIREQTGARLRDRWEGGPWGRWQHRDPLAILNANPAPLGDNEWPR